MRGLGTRGVFPACAIRVPETMKYFMRLEGSCFGRYEVASDFVSGLFRVKVVEFSVNLICKGCFQ